MSCDGRAASVVRLWAVRGCAVVGDPGADPAERGQQRERGPIMSTTGQTINDRLTAAKHSLAGQGLAKAVCKASTEELMGPKKKHLDYLLHCTEEPNVSIPTLANLLIERTNSPNWIVAFKGLVSIHHMMNYGNERFVQYLASSNSSFELSEFLDKSTGGTSYSMSPFVRRYAKYLKEKSASYRATAFDFCKVKRGKDGGTLRSMTADKLLKTLPILQVQVDALLEFEVTSQDLNNGVINAAFMLLFKDLIRLFASYNDGIINLLEKYFEMNKKHARDALEVYKKFLIRMDKVGEFLKVAERFGIDKSDIPDLARAPSSLLEALEAHLASLEGRKPGSAATTPTNVPTGGAKPGFDDIVEKQLIGEEEAAMAKIKEHHRATNPFAAAAESAALQPAAAPSGGVATSNTPNILDLFGVPESAAAAAAATMTIGQHTNGTAGAGANKASDDLLQLAGNPFASVMPTAAANATSSGAGGFAFGGAATAQQPAAHAAAAASTNDIGASFFSGILQPQGAAAGGAGGAGGGSGSKQSPTDGSKVIVGDLDASLANLTSNLDLGAPQSKPGFATQSKGPPMGAMGQGTSPFM